MQRCPPPPPAQFVVKLRPIVVVLLLAALAGLAAFIVRDAAAQTDPQPGGPCNANNLPWTLPVFTDAQRMQISLQIQNCESNGWALKEVDLTSFGVNVRDCYCQIKSRDARTSSQCTLNQQKQCAMGVTPSNAACAYYYGPNLEHIPRRTAENADDCFVAKCPNFGEPSGFNMNGETECECPPNSRLENEECVCAEGLTRDDNGQCVLQCEPPKVANDDKTECVCPADYRALGDNCIPDAENFGGDVSQQYLCRAFGGTLQMAGNGEACSGMDRRDTFCIVDSVGAFPCRGLFKHLRACNLDYQRPAFDMFFCGAKCGSGRTAVGAECR